MPDPADTPITFPIKITAVLPGAELENILRAAVERFLVTGSKLLADVIVPELELQVWNGGVWVRLDAKGVRFATKGSQ